MPEVPILVCTSGALRGQRFRVPEGGLDIGRADENHITITDEGVSRFHARMLYNYESGKLWLEDAGSRNGVFVNENRVSGHLELKVGDQVTVALHTFAVRWDDETPAPASATAPPKTPDASTSDGKPKRRWFWPFS
jgi:pSer/pThr/pTyr-binding forkhead associated (FHA) protein